MIQPIPTWYAGHKFRSRLEARWAVFLNHMRIPWEYETEGYLIDRSAGAPTCYLPDFRLPECGTWIEVKGAEAALDKELMYDAATQLPQHRDGGEHGPALLVLGPIPEPGTPARGGGHYDWGWVAPMRGEDTQPRYGFGVYHKNNRPWYLDNASNASSDRWLTPVLDSSEIIEGDAYRAARSARFEHGQSGGSS